MFAHVQKSSEKKKKEEKNTAKVNTYNAIQASKQASKPASQQASKQTNKHENRLIELKQKAVYINEI